MSKNSTQSWVIILSVVVVALSIALLLTKKAQHQSKNDKNIELAYQQAQLTATYTPTPLITEPVAAVKPVETIVTPVANQYGIQVVSLRDQDKAQAFLNKLSTTGLTGYITQADLGNQKITYRVFIGPIASYEDAKNQLPAVKAIYKDAFIFKN